MADAGAEAPRKSTLHARHRPMHPFVAERSFLLLEAQAATLGLHADQLAAQVLEKVFDAKLYAAVMKWQR